MAALLREGTRPVSARAAAARASHVAVSGAGKAAPASPAPESIRQQHARLRRDALQAARAGAPFVLASVAIALLTDAIVFAPSTAHWTWLACTLLLVGAWCGVLGLPPRSPARAVRAARAEPAVIALAMGWIVVLAMQPWLRVEQGVPLQRVASMLALGAVAITVAAALAALRWPAAAAALLPLSATAAAWHHEGRSSVALLGGGLFLFTCGVAWSRRRAWLRGAALAIAREDRARELEAERDAASRADLEKSRFLAIASHDLRQPMHALGLFAATLEKRLRGSDEEPLVRNLVRAIEGLDRSFNVMLDISRLDAGTIEPNFQRFPLRDLFRRLHMHFAGQAEQAGLGLRFAPGGKSVTSDPQLLERLLGNLIQNAIKYTECGGIVVVARTTSTHVNVEVWDTGTGIPAPALPRIFDEFYQIGRGERARDRGFGMGLAIVKRLAQLLGHRLVVASQPGRGTMFRVGIPVGGMPEIQDVTAAADTLPMPLPVSQPRTVLVVDDESSIRHGLALLLREWGYEVIAAGTVEEAVRAVRRLEVPPDIILSDLHLGDGPDGLAAVDAVRRLCGCDVPAILVTGDTSHEELRRATESGHPVLFKPVQPRKLLNALRGYIP